MIATDMTTGGSVEERLRWAFKMYDQDGSGEVNYNQYNKVDTTNRCEALKEVMSLNYV